jgi:hypothetical protein
MCGERRARSHLSPCCAAGRRRPHGSAGARGAAGGSLPPGCCIWPARLVPADWLEGPAYTLSTAGTEYLFEIGVELSIGRKPWAPVYVVLDSDGQSKRSTAFSSCTRSTGRPSGHADDSVAPRCIDLLEDHLRRDPDLLRPELGCGQPFPGTGHERLPRRWREVRCPRGGGVRELAIARWLLGAAWIRTCPRPLTRTDSAEHAALFGATSMPHFWMNFSGWAHSKKPNRHILELLDAGADPSARATCESSGPASLHRDGARLGSGVRDQMVVSDQRWLLAARGGS